MENNDQGFEKLQVNYTEYTTRLSKSFKERSRYEPEDKRNILSFIPGTIIEVLVAEGDLLNNGEEVLVLEAMKMKNRIKCFAEGKVKKIYVQEGDTVPKGTLLMEIE